MSQLWHEKGGGAGGAAEGRKAAEGKKCKAQTIHYSFNNISNPIIIKLPTLAAAVKAHL